MNSVIFTKTDQNKVQFLRVLPEKVKHFRPIETDDERKMFEKTEKLSAHEIKVSNTMIKVTYNKPNSPISSPSMESSVLKSPNWNDIFLSAINGPSSTSSKNRKYYNGDYESTENASCSSYNTKYKENPIRKRTSVDSSTFSDNPELEYLESVKVRPIKKRKITIDLESESSDSIPQVSFEKKDTSNDDEFQIIKIGGCENRKISNNVQMLPHTNHHESNAALIKRMHKNKIINPGVPCVGRDYNSFTIIKKHNQNKFLGSPMPIDYFEKFSESKSLVKKPTVFISTPISSQQSCVAKDVSNSSEDINNDLRIILENSNNMSHLMNVSTNTSKPGSDNILKIKSEDYDIIKKYKLSSQLVVTKKKVNVNTSAADKISAVDFVKKYSGNKQIVKKSIVFQNQGEIKKQNNKSINNIKKVKPKALIVDSNTANLDHDKSETPVVKKKTPKVKVEDLSSPPKAKKQKKDTTPVKKKIKENSTPKKSSASKSNSHSPRESSSTKKKKLMDGESSKVLNISTESSNGSLNYSDPNIKLGSSTLMSSDVSGCADADNTDRSSNQMHNAEDCYVKLEDASTLINESQQRKRPKKYTVRSSSDVMYIDPTLPEGWKREIYIRKGGQSEGKQEVHILSPSGRRFRFRSGLQKYLEEKGMTLDINSFNFKLYYPSKKKENDNSVDDSGKKKKRRRRALDIEHTDAEKKKLEEYALKVGKTPMLVDPNLPEGWKRFVMCSEGDEGSEGRLNISIISPNGKRFWQKAKLAAYLSETSSQYKISQFSFSKFGEAGKKKKIILKNIKGFKIRQKNKHLNNMKANLKKKKKNLLKKKTAKDGKGGKSNKPVIFHYAFPIMEHDPNLPSGWVRSVKRRQDGGSTGRVDVAIVSPDGKKFRSKGKLEKYLEETQSNLKISQFDFTVCGKHARKQLQTTEKKVKGKPKKVKRSISKVDDLPDEKQPTERLLINSVNGLAVHFNMTTQRGERKLRMPQPQHEENIKESLDNYLKLASPSKEEVQTPAPEDKIMPSWIQLLAKCRSDIGTLELDAAESISNATKHFVTEFLQHTLEVASIKKTLDESTTPVTNITYDDVVTVVENTKSLTKLSSLVPKKIKVKQFRRLNRPKTFMSFT